MTPTPARYKFKIWKGATFRIRLTLHQGDANSPVRDLTDYEAELVIKDKPDGTTLLTMSTGNGKIAIGDAFGTIDLVLTAVETQALTWKSGIYDLLITAPSGGDTDVLIHGNFEVQGI